MTFFNFESYFQRLFAVDDFTQRESVRTEFHSHLNSLPESEQHDLRKAYEDFVRQRNQKDLVAIGLLKEIFGEPKAA